MSRAQLVRRIYDRHDEVVELNNHQHLVPALLLESSKRHVKELKRRLRNKASKAYQRQHGLEFTLHTQNQHNVLVKILSGTCENFIHCLDTAKIGLSGNAKDDIGAVKPLPVIRDIKFNPDTGLDQNLVCAQFVIGYSGYEHISLLHQQELDPADISLFSPIVLLMRSLGVTFLKQTKFEATDNNNATTLVVDIKADVNVLKSLDTPFLTPLSRAVLDDIIRQIEHTNEHLPRSVPHHEAETSEQKTSFNQSMMLSTDDTKALVEQVQISQLETTFLRGESDRMLPAYIIRTANELPIEMAEQFGRYCREHAEQLNLTVELLSDIQNDKFTLVLVEGEHRQLFRVLQATDCLMSHLDQQVDQYQFAEIYAVYPVETNEATLRVQLQCRYFLDSYEINEDYQPVDVDLSAQHALLKPITTAFYKPDYEAVLVSSPDNSSQQMVVVMDFDPEYIARAAMALEVYFTDTAYQQMQKVIEDANNAASIPPIPEPANERPNRPNCFIDAISLEVSKRDHNLATLKVKLAPHPSSASDITPNDVRELVRCMNQQVPVGLKLVLAEQVGKENTYILSFSHGNLFDFLEFINSGLQYFCSLDGLYSLAALEQPAELSSIHFRHLRPQTTRLSTWLESNVSNTKPSDSSVAGTPMAMAAANLSTMTEPVEPIALPMSTAAAQVTASSLAEPADLSASSPDLSKAPGVDTASGTAKPVKQTSPASTSFFAPASDGTFKHFAPHKPHRANESSVALSLMHSALRVGMLASIVIGFIQLAPLYFVLAALLAVTDKLLTEMTQYDVDSVPSVGM